MASAHETPAIEPLSPTPLVNTSPQEARADGNVMNTTVLSENPLEIRPLRTMVGIQRDRLPDQLHFNPLQNAESRTQLKQLSSSSRSKTKG